MSYVNVHDAWFTYYVNILSFRVYFQTHFNLLPTNKPKSCFCSSKSMWHETLQRQELAPHSRWKLQSSLVSGKNLDPCNPSARSQVIIVPHCWHRWSKMLQHWFLQRCAKRDIMTLLVQYSRNLDPFHSWIHMFWSWINIVTNGGKLWLVMASQPFPFQGLIRPY